MYIVCELVQAFDPAYAVAHVDTAFMARLSAIKPLGDLVPGLTAELPKCALPRFPFFSSPLLDSPPRLASAQVPHARQGLRLRLDRRGHLHA